MNVFEISWLEPETVGKFRSDFRIEVSEKSMTKGFLEQRNKLLAAGKIKDLVTTEDILFSSSSAAGAVLAGYNVSGPMNWKNASGKSLKEIEAEKMNEK